MTTTTVVPGRYHVHTRMNPHPNMATKAQSSTETLPETGLHQTPESLRCHHFVPCSGHTSRHWPRSLLLNLRDQKRHSTASPEKLAHWQGSISSLLYCPPQSFSKEFKMFVCQEFQSATFYNQLKRLVVVVSSFVKRVPVSIARLSYIHVCIWWRTFFVPKKLRISILWVWILKLLCQKPLAGMNAAWLFSKFNLIIISLQKTWV
jgi:hypothetical protein